VVEENPHRKCVGGRARRSWSGEASSEEAALGPFNLVAELVLI